jgi:probable F420-dependent oxidoreductase
MEIMKQPPAGMKVGAVYPQIELAGDPNSVRRFGRAVEDLGFDHLLAYEHVLGAVHADRTPPLTGPYTERDPFHDPLVMFAHLAGITERIGFGTGILVLPQRQTALVARQAADVDLLSGGRLRLGVGVGWNYVEYQALGEDFHTRGARQEEQIELLRRLFTEPVVDFSGRFDRVDRAALAPKPTRSIPIWLGGSGAAAFERAARLADGFIIFAGGADHAAATWNRLRDRVDALGRQAAEFGGDYVVLAQGSVSELTEQIDAWREAGGTHASVVTMGLGFSGVDDHIDYLASVANALRLSLRPYRASPRARPGRVIHITTFTFVQVAAAMMLAPRPDARPPQVTGTSEPLR